jgi:hypothetical protein
MRCGLPCANTFGAKPDTAPNANAAVPPASIARRLTSVAANDCMQQLQTADSPRMALDMMNLRGPALKSGGCAYVPSGAPAGQGRNFASLKWAARP